MPDQRHPWLVMIAFDPIFQFLIDLAKTLLVDELSQRVRAGRQRLAEKRSTKMLLLRLHHRNRKRLMNRLRTAQRAET